MGLKPDSGVWKCLLIPTDPGTGTGSVEVVVDREQVNADIRLDQGGDAVRFIKIHLFSLCVKNEIVLMKEFASMTSENPKKLFLNSVCIKLNFCNTSKCYIFNINDNIQNLTLSKVRLTLQNLNPWIPIFFSINNNDISTVGLILF